MPTDTTTQSTNYRRAYDHTSQGYATLRYVLVLHYRHDRPGYDTSPTLTQCIDTIPSVAQSTTTIPPSRRSTTPPYRSTNVLPTYYTTIHTTIDLPIYRSNPYIPRYLSLPTGKASDHYHRVSHRSIPRPSEGQHPIDVRYTHRASTTITHTITDLDQLPLSFS